MAVTTKRSDYVRLLVADTRGVLTPIYANMANANVSDMSEQSREGERERETAIYGIQLRASETSGPDEPTNNYSVTRK